jgi:site-specific recombinase XerD
MHPALRAAVATYLQQRYPESAPVELDVLFPSRQGDNGPLSSMQAWRILKGAASAAGVKDRIGTHSMRKTFCQAIYDRTGHDIRVTQAAMGHRYLETTSRYLDVSQKAVEAAELGIRSPGLEVVPALPLAAKPIPAPKAPRREPVEQALLAFVS